VRKGVRPHFSAPALPVTFNSSQSLKSRGKKEGRIPHGPAPTAALQTSCLKSMAYELTFMRFVVLSGR
jgi:hypothetical protein